MTTHHMTVPFDVKGARRKTRMLTGLASALARDLADDVIEPTAYDAWLANFRAGRLPPVTLNDTHRYGSIYDVVGKLVRAERVPQGLMTAFEFIPDDPTAKAAWRRAAGGYITGLSIGFTAKARTPTADEHARGVKRVLTEVNISEVSLVQYPAQPLARIVSVGDADIEDAVASAETLARRRSQVAKLSDLVQRATQGAARLRETDHAKLKVTLSKLHTDHTRPMSHATRQSVRQTLQALRRQQLDAVRDGARRLHSTRIP
jgi:HK97 family phage prohead protease